MTRGIHLETCLRNSCHIQKMQKRKVSAAVVKAGKACRDVLDVLVEVKAKKAKVAEAELEQFVEDSRSSKPKSLYHILSRVPFDVVRLR
jgi:hypothetical protein